MTAPAAAERPYATWDPSLATDEPDGLPDRAIVPLVEALRSRGVVTLQSCAGHPGTDDGCLWVRADSVDGAHLRLFVLDVVGRDVFDRVSLTYWPERRWEFVWRPENAGIAMAALGWLKPADTTTATSPSVAADLTEPTPEPDGVPCRRTHPHQPHGARTSWGEYRCPGVHSPEPVPAPDSVPGLIRAPKPGAPVDDHVCAPLIAARQNLDIQRRRERHLVKERNAARTELAEVIADRDQRQKLVESFTVALRECGAEKREARGEVAAEGTSRD